MQEFHQNINLTQECGKKKKNVEKLAALVKLRPPTSGDLGTSKVWVKSTVQKPINNCKPTEFTFRLLWLFFPPTYFSEWIQRLWNPGSHTVPAGTLAQWASVTAASALCDRGGAYEAGLVTPVSRKGWSESPKVTRPRLSVSCWAQHICGLLKAQFYT